MFELLENICGIREGTAGGDEPSLLCGGCDNAASEPVTAEGNGGGERFESRFLIISVDRDIGIGCVGAQRAIVL